MVVWVEGDRGGDGKAGKKPSASFPSLPLPPESPGPTPRFDFTMSLSGAERGLQWFQLLQDGT